MKFNDTAWSADMVYPVLYMPKKCATIEPTYDYRDNIYMDVTIRSIDVEGKEASLYSGFCNIKLIENYDIILQNSQRLLATDTVNIGQYELLSEPSNLSLNPPYNQSQVWIDPVRSPYIYNTCNATSSQDKFSVYHQNNTNNVAVNQHNTYITQNIYNCVEPHEVNNNDFEKVTSSNETTQAIGSPELSLDYLYDDDDFECELFLSQFPEDLINEEDDKQEEEVVYKELETENDALKQLMSPAIQSLSKQQKTILFLGSDSHSGETVQKIPVDDPLVECIPESEIDHVATIEKRRNSTKKKYQCEKCKQIFDQLATFKQHTVSHRSRLSVCDGDVDNFVCNLCGKKLKTRDKFEAHRAGHGDPDLECDLCLKVFASKFTLRTHRKIHMRKYSCDLCPKTFSKLAELKAHSSKAHSLYRCETCPYTTHSKQDITNHRDSHLDWIEDEDRLSVAVENETIDTVYAKNETPRKVRKSQRKTKEKPLESEKMSDADSVIAKVMSNKIFLLHSKLARKEKKFNKSCTICAKSFDRIGDLKRHLIEHVVVSTLAKNPVDKNGSLSIECQVCREATFTKTDKYKEHLRAHAKLTLYQCTLCNKSFSDSSNFSKHKKIHGSKYFQCDLCQRKFNSKKMITVHMDYHKKNSPLNCDFCDKEFYFKSMLNKHVKYAHIKEVSSRFRCRFCHGYYSTLKEKWDHEWFVHKVRKVVADCWVCDSKFRKYSELKRHCNLVHSLDIPPAKKLFKKD